MPAPLSADPFPPAPEYHGYTSRLATPEERRYLRRFNWIRLMRHLMFGANFVFFGALAGVFIWLAAMMFFKGDTGQALFMSALSLVLPSVYFFWWRPALPDLIRLRPVLRIPAQVEVVCFRDRLTTIAHETSWVQNIYSLRARQPLLELPSHWEAMVSERQEDSYVEFPVEVARLPGASGKVLRLRMFSETRSYRVDPTLPDLGDFVLRFGDLSIAQEMRAGLPVIRANDSFGLFAFVTMLLGLFAALFSWIWLDHHNADAVKLASTIEGISAIYDGGAPVPAEALSARGIDGLHPDAEFGQRALYATPVTLYEVTLPHGMQSFYLTEDELSSILRISAIYPRNLTGYDQPAAELVEEYRALVTTQIGAFEAIPPAMAQTAAALPDAVIARQLRALSLGNTPDRDFVAALLPQPMIVPPTETNPYFVRPQPFCHPGDTICGQRDAPVTYADVVFTAQDGAVVLQTTADLQQLAEKRAELAALDADVSQYRMLQTSGSIALLAAMGWLSSCLASWRIRRWHRKQTAHPAA